ncbi:protein BUNDLE SHEATH DEFECTIVE 2, chloroplastic-like [Triticum urartu]|nr:protein BUNDLE SHEATH DEFECTIVE 2, chloroplastic-like [Triticum urartu]
MGRRKRPGGAKVLRAPPLSRWIGLLSSILLAAHLYSPNSQLPPSRCSRMAATSGLTATVTSPPAALRTLAPPGLFLRPISRCSRPHSLKAKAAAKDQDEKKPEATKKKAYSLVCTACEGNGAIACTQCKGGGENLEDHFGGRFKAGGLCWLCRGKREILCGSCNGAGFLGGFMSTADDTSE